MGKLLFESKGLAKKAKVLFTVCTSIMVLGGIFFIVLANQKRGTGSMYSSIGNGYSYMGSYGGGYVLNESGRTGFTIMGIVFLVLGVLFFCSMLSMRKSYVKIFEDGVKGASYVSILFFNIKREYDINYSEIKKIQRNKNMYGDIIIVWTTYGERYSLVIDNNANEAVRIIEQRIE